MSDLDLRNVVKVRSLVDAILARPTLNWYASPLNNGIDTALNARGKVVDEIELRVLAGLPDALEPETPVNFLNRIAGELYMRNDLRDSGMIRRVADSLVGHAIILKKVGVK